MWYHVYTVKVSVLKSTKGRAGDTFSKAFLQTSKKALAPEINLGQQADHQDANLEKQFEHPDIHSQQQFEHLESQQLDRQFEHILCLIQANKPKAVTGNFHVLLAGFIIFPVNVFDSSFLHATHTSHSQFCCTYNKSSVLCECEEKRNLFSILSSLFPLKWFVVAACSSLLISAYVCCSSSCMRTNNSNI